MVIVKNGCVHHNDCFTCPFEDCKLTDESSALSGKGRKWGASGIDWTDPEQVRKYRREHMQKTRAEKLANELRCAGFHDENAKSPQ